MKKHLTPMDVMRLDAARDRTGFKPSVERYNAMTRSEGERYIGQPITPIGTSGSQALD